MIPLLAVACHPPEGGSDRSIEVDCRGLTYRRSANMFLALSPMWAQDLATGEAVERCTMIGSEAQSGGPLTIVAGAAAASFSEETDLGNVQVYALGREWVALSGEIRPDEHEDGRAIGTYTATATGTDPVTGETSEAEISGRFDWCEFGRHPDCPQEIGGGNIDGELEIGTGWFDPPVTGSPVACRMLVDRATGALQVDLQVGIWDGQNVGQLWVNECSAGGAIPPAANRFVFRAGGVTGPGTYGPQPSVTFPSSRLPGLEWEHPMTFLLGLNEVSACNMYSTTGLATTDDLSSCTWTVDRDAGRFTVDCTEVRHVSPAWTVMTFDLRGPFHLASDCEYLER